MREPAIELKKRLGSERIEASLAVRAHGDEARLLEDPEVSRDARLMDADFFDDVADGTFTITQRLYDSAACGVGERFEWVKLH